MLKILLQFFLFVFTLSNRLLLYGPRTLFLWLGCCLEIVGSSEGRDYLLYFNIFKLDLLPVCEQSPELAELIDGSMRAVLVRED